MDTTLERYLHAMALFVLGVTILGHGMSATVFIDGVTPVTMLLPLVGSAVAYRSLVSLLPADSSVRADQFLILLATLTAGFVNLVIPPVYDVANVLPGVATPPTYWTTLVAGTAGFTAMAVYELLAERVGTRFALTKLLVSGVLATGVGILFLVAPAKPAVYVRPTDALVGIVGAIVASALFDHARRRGVRRTVNEPN